MNYEKAWKDLKSLNEMAVEASRRFAESEGVKDDERLKAQGGEAIVRSILCFMYFAEKEMTTVGEDDGQSAQD